MHPIINNVWDVFQNATESVGMLGATVLVMFAGTASLFVRLWRP